jgi:hypothetical protein
MKQKKINRIVVKWCTLIALFSLSIFVEKLYAFRVYVYNSRPHDVRLDVFNGQQCNCLKKVIPAQSPSFIDIGPVLTICTEPINKIDIYALPSKHETCSQKKDNVSINVCGSKRNNPNKEQYIGTIQGKNILYNPDIVI